MNYYNKFEDHKNKRELLDFVHGIMYSTENVQRLLIELTPFHSKLVAHKEDLRKIDLFFNKEMFIFLKAASDFIHPKDSLRLLLFLRHDPKALEDAKELIEGLTFKKQFVTSNDVNYFGRMIAASTEVPIILLQFYAASEEEEFNQEMKDFLKEYDYSGVDKLFDYS